MDYTASTASIFNLFILSLDRYWSGYCKIEAEFEAVAPEDLWDLLSLYFDILLNPLPCNILLPSFPLVDHVAAALPASPHQEARPRHDRPGVDRRLHVGHPHPRLELHPLRGAEAAAAADGCVTLRSLTIIGVVLGVQPGGGRFAQYCLYEVRNLAL